MIELGVGQTSILHWRYTLVDFLPPMFIYHFRVTSKKPQPILAWDTLIYPFDQYMWYFIAASILAVVIALILIQNVWTFASGEQPPNGWVFQGCKD